MKHPEKILTSKTYQAFARLIASPNLASAANFLHTKNLMVSAMHFQDAYNFDLDRVCRCLVHYGVVDPEDNTKTKLIPFFVEATGSDVNRRSFFSRNNGTSLSNNFSKIPKSWR